MGQKTLFLRSGIVIFCVSPDIERTIITVTFSSHLLLKFEVYLASQKSNRNPVGVELR